jgi:hypothetical protein
MNHFTKSISNRSDQHNDDSCDDKFEQGIENQSAGPILIIGGERARSEVRQRDYFFF